MFCWNKPALVALCAQALAGSCPQEVLPLSEHHAGFTGGAVGTIRQLRSLNRRYNWCVFVPMCFSFVPYNFTSPCRFREHLLHGLSHRPLFLMGKLEMGICKVNHRPCCCSWSWDVTGSHPYPYTLFILNYRYPQLPPWQVLVVMEPPSQSLRLFHLYAHHASFGGLTMKADYGHFIYLIAHHLLCGGYFLVAITV